MNQIDKDKSKAPAVDKGSEAAEQSSGEPHASPEKLKEVDRMYEDAAKQKAGENPDPD